MAGALDPPQTVHGTAIAMGGKAALLRGQPGAGKSDLALRCLAVGHSALLPDPVYLVCDDRAIITREWDDIIVSAPSRIFGSIEVRGLGIVIVPSHSPAVLVLVVDLIEAAQPIERLPDPLSEDFYGIPVSVIAVHPFEASAALKILMALRAASVVGNGD